MDKKNKFIIVALFIFIGSILFNYRAKIKEIYVPSSITVKISGNIQKPGIYQLKHGDNLQKLVDIAGGLLNNNTVNYNSKEPLKNGQIIKIGSGGQNDD